MHMGGLYNGAPGCGEPAKTFRHTQLSDPAAVFLSGTDALKRIYVLPELVEVKMITQHLKPVFVYLRLAPEKLFGPAIKNHADVEKLSALHMGHHSDDRILK